MQDQAEMSPPPPPIHTHTSAAPARRNGWQGRALALGLLGLAEHAGFPLGRHSSSHKKRTLLSLESPVRTFKG